MITDTQLHEKSSEFGSSRKSRKPQRVLNRRWLLVALCVALVGAVLFVAWSLGEREPQRISTEPIAAPAEVEDTTVPHRSEEQETVSALENGTTQPITDSRTTCLNSHDPACGPFFWTRDPGPNEPLRIQLVITPSSPKVGEEVNFEVALTDPDAHVNDSSYFFGFGDGGDPVPWSATVKGCLQSELAYGGWNPPPRIEGRSQWQFRHIYDKAGSYTAKFYFRSFNNTVCGHDPYGSLGERFVTVEVT